MAFQKFHTETEGAVYQIKHQQQGDFGKGIWSLSFGYTSETKNLESYNGRHKADRGLVELPKDLTGPGNTMCGQKQSSRKVSRTVSSSCTTY